ncbi:potassium channel protein [Haloferax mediterranei ATCC 33500]|uniref:Potassium channel protein n=1 Tax=Haloferax mediterranei (strain ATCC 33500 / DSM 1411 / JCM 8866 / NBRC 14739 / NCIMB 2177 / R-4) TaxID=523841 RepID=I3R1Q8_HALMT|nr:TrkA C-terminal domain-containing protein [Haloferax mediterranei]AFK18168.1 potassium channel protein [Haloferax mediterranei ATCC 33500]AHZ22425.1 potassium channel protein [Haloferax mediterranei ATCC 33500]EMA02559.1 potassium channel protein [Haloferax mediterranei ATCC 33500]MDX5988258.1 TrkA C-terminal domain-containing protein [Haloferax mediterranei ATCC 33500]QCQ74698.1 potassium channel protein [Haloferax mediterranei ATCC 33500]
MNPEDIEYEPVSVKAVLAEMKDTAELLIDLSYSSVLHANDELAAEVLDLEERMDILQLQARMSLMMAARSPEDAEELAPVLGVVGAAEKISDAAGDIAKVVIEDIGLPDAIRAALPEAVETTIRCELTDDSPYAARTLGDINMETETGVRVVAIHRAGEWVTNPDFETTLHAGDVLLLRGRDEGLQTVHEAATGIQYNPPDVAEPTIEDLERAVDTIVLMKDMSELAVDLAYGAVLFDSEGVAEEVEELEAEVDALKSRFEAWTLRAASRVEDPVSLRGLVQLASATEIISDAALEIAEGVLRGIDAHPVVAAAVKESDEVIIRLRVAPQSTLAEATLGDRRVKTETGMRVIAVRRAGGRRWVVSPGSETRLHGGDLIIAKGTRAGAERLGELLGDEREFDE